MTPEWVKIDVRLMSSEKILACSVEARWLYVTGLCLAGRDLTDGVIRPSVAIAEADLPDLGVDPSVVADELIAAGLWHGTSHDCRQCPEPLPGRVVVHDYLDWNRSRAEAEGQREEKSRAGKLGAAARWNSSRHGSRHGKNDGTADGETMPESESESENYFSQSLTSPKRDEREHEIDEIHKITRGPRSHAERVRDLILARAVVPVQNPLRYVLTAIERDPDRYRHRRGNPKPHEDCAHHPGEFADACRQCALNAKTGAET